MKKILKITIYNLVLFTAIFFISDYVLYKFSSEPTKYLKDHPLSTSVPKYHYTFKNPKIPYTELDGYFNNEDNIFAGRKPFGTNYKTAPILIFGDSFAHGQYLEPNQTFGYKLSKTLKRPVYNRAIPGSGFQHMYYQVTPPFSSIFFNQVPKTDTVIYIMINDHYLRMSIFSDFDITGDYFHLHYNYKNGKLVKDNYSNPILNFLKSSYTIKAINLKYLDYTIGSPLFAEHYTNNALHYFVETRKMLEEKWQNKINFTVILYDNTPIYYKDLLTQKLKGNNFNVIDTSELTTKNLNSETYLMQDNLHPTEKAWDLLTPKIIKRLN